MYGHIERPDISGRNNRIYPGNQSLPFTIRATTILATLSPTAFIMVAGGSINAPIIDMIGNASRGNPLNSLIHRAVYGKAPLAQKLFFSRRTLIFRIFMISIP
jgi:hypothetical protein